MTLDKESCPSFDMMHWKKLTPAKWIKINQQESCPSFDLMHWKKLTPAKWKKNQSTGFCGLYMF